MSDFEDNNPFAGADRRDSVSSDPEDDGPSASFLATNAANDFGGGSFGGSFYGAASQIGSMSAYDPESALANPFDDGHSTPKPAETTNDTNETNETTTSTSNIPPIEILDANKNHEGTSRGFITYTIRVGDLSVRRRYSEFESLRTTLTRMFPTLIVPPIPEKHSIADYAVAPTKAREDKDMIEHRQRMLQVFLNRCRNLPQIAGCIVFQRFLDPHASWSEVLNSPPVSTLPRYSLRAPPVDPSNNVTEAHSYLPIPSANGVVRNRGGDEEGRQEAFFAEAEKTAKEYEGVIGGGLEKVARRILKRYTDIAGDYAELGGRFNALSLEESDARMAATVEKVGQAIDSNYLATNHLVRELGRQFGEPLAESAQFSGVVRSVLKYRKQKALQLELTSDSLEAKRVTLASLEAAEADSQRISDALGRARGSAPESTDAPAAPAPKKSSGFKIPGLSSLNSAFNNMMDADPEASRRQGIGKTREQIGQLEQALKVAQKDIVVANESVEKDLERFRAEREADLKRMIRAFLKCHIDWAKQNLDTWQAAQAEVESM
ncbi:Sorting nexin-41 [Yarrowia sp. B02]|nr:Sorting nexin-41 [Yarrowia sp. B02]